MTAFRVYLPPTTLDALPLPASSSRSAPLSFVELVQPASVDRSFSQSLPRRHEDIVHQLLLQSADSRTIPPVDPQTAQDDRKRRRKSGSSGLEESRVVGVTKDVSEQMEVLPDSIESTGTAESGDMRRSKRLARTSESLMATLPQLAPSASILSLNTTTSNPSQMIGNETLQLPKWHIPVSRLTSLSTLMALPRPLGTTRMRRGSQMNHKHAISLIVCVMSVENPVCRQRAEEKARGAQGTLWIGGWKVAAPPAFPREEPPSCGVKLWDTLARDWGDDTIRKGDVVLLEKWKHPTPKEPASIVLSSSNSGTSPKITILYRTLPRYALAVRNYTTYGRSKARPSGGGGIVPQDQVLRPDLRLARSDPGVRKVADVAKWFAEWVEGDAPG